jgi:hypothetical protein
MEHWERNCEEAFAIPTYRKQCCSIAAIEDGKMATAKAPSFMSKKTTNSIRYDHPLLK